MRISETTELDHHTWCDLRKPLNPQPLWPLWGKLCGFCRHGDSIPAPEGPGTACLQGSGTGCGRAGNSREREMGTRRGAPASGFALARMPADAVSKRVSRARCGLGPVLGIYSGKSFNPQTT